MNECEKDVLLNGKLMRPVIKGKTVLPPVAKSNLYKTQLCRNFMSNGKCKYGRVCQFAHGRKELEKYSSIVCSAYMGIGSKSLLQTTSANVFALHPYPFSFLFHRNGVFWDACWSWLGARPRTALWQTGGNGTHAVRSAVGRAVGRTAHTGGAGLWNRRQAHGVLAVTGSIPLGGSPRLLSVTRALLPKRVFYLEGGGRKH